ncbi:MULTISPECIES: WavE lipopolysaccharide synthesis family protein [Vibrio]|uniref:WavE lipopolysaccharide synthesis family protein n=1 Tax=Vibrio TaxID=662 RepID=UPI000C17034D|nr:WavE lipopolysaccharide synthesis family protein [Vibrio fujianensis]
MDYCDITVVVQGPVQTFQDRPQEDNITQKCIASIREYLPGAHIILSTWPEQDLTGLDYDELVISKDPGSNIRDYNLNGTPHYYNNNRQIVSTIEGLKKVKTKYSVKLRSDNYLTSNNFVKLQQEFNKRTEEYCFFKERVIVSNVFTRKYAKGFRVAFHVSDFFYYGLTEDLLSLWDIPLFNDFKSTCQVKYYDSYPYFITDCTQELFLSGLKKFKSSLNIIHLLDISNDKIIESEHIYANNLIIVPQEQLGLGLCQKFLGKSRVSRAKGKCAHYQYHEWLALYKKYCDKNIHIPLFKWLSIKVFFQRCLYVFPTKLETWYKMYKRSRG